MRTRVSLLDADPDLAGPLDPQRREAAREALWALAVHVDDQRFEPARYADLARGGLGLFLLDGVLLRQIGREHRRSAEILGSGDVLRPWEHDGEDATVPLKTAWSVVEPVSLAVLDCSFIRRATPFPEVVGELFGRSVQRSLTLATHLAILHEPRVETRLHLLFWHLAERWGRVTPDGVIVRLPLSHRLIGELVAARRPTVTIAINQMERAGLLTRREDGWLLKGEPPFDEDMPTDPVAHVDDRRAG